MSASAIQTVGIFGVGLIGGSFALGLRHAGFRGRIIGVSSHESIETALRMGAIDEAASEAEAAAKCDLLYLAQPIREIIECLPRIAPLIKSDAVVTDAGSTKAVIVNAGSTAIGERFLGGHPLTGKETSGIASAEVNLFANRKYVLTPQHSQQLENAKVKEMLAWLSKMRAITWIMTASDHDHVVAYTSHLQQLAATGLSLCIGRSKAGTDVFGPALLDMTRLALSPYEVWGDILRTNTDSIRTALRNYVEILQSISRELDTVSMRGEFAEAAQVAKALRGTKTLQ